MYFIDVFCGAGGFSEGFKMAGWKHVVGVEWDKFAAATYAANNDGDVIVKDAREVKLSDLTPFLKKHGVAGKLDALIGSPPCTSFSMAGLRKPGDDRDDLYKEVLRLGKLLQPRWIVMENVVGMLSKRDKSGKTFADLVVEDLKKIGYHCEYRVLTATAFGVPQIRKRVIFVASKNPKDIAFPVPNVVDSRQVPVRRVLEPHDRVPAKFWMSREKIKWFDERPQYARYIDVDKACPTIRAGYFRSRGEHSLLKLEDGRVRMLTDKEVARIQGFPKTFKFVGSLTQKYKQIGNAVAPPMAKGIAGALKP